MVKDILIHPNKILRTESAIVEDFSNPKLSQLIKDLKSTLKVTSNGLGLAAPQIGVNMRVFAIKNEDRSIKIFINPRFSNFFKKAKKEKMIEGCLSIPGVSVSIFRVKKVLMKYTNENGEKLSMRAKGVLAQAFQHEIDHLDGVLCIDRVRK